MLNNNTNQKNQKLLKNNSYYKYESDQRQRHLSIQQQIHQLKVMNTKFFDYLNNRNSSIQALQKQNSKSKRSFNNRQDSMDSCSTSYQNRINYQNSSVSKKERCLSRLKQKLFQQNVNNIRKKLQAHHDQSIGKDAKIQLENGSYLTGQIKNGEIQYGCMYFADGKKFQGNLKNFQCNGLGKLTLINSTIYTSTFENGRMAKNGQITYQNGDYYKGQIENYKKNGIGQLQFKDGHKYVGNFFKGQITGYGKYFIGQEQIEGLWNKGTLLHQFNQQNLKCSYLKYSIAKPRP